MSDGSDPTDRAILDCLRDRDGLLTEVLLGDGQRLRCFNIAWGYDRGDRFAHVTTNISPYVEGEAVYLFFTNDVAELIEPDDGTRLFRRQREG